jgi:hypothetical protein
LSWEEEKVSKGVCLLHVVVCDGGQVVSAEAVCTDGDPLLAVADVDVIVEAAMLSDVGHRWEVMGFPLLQWTGRLVGESRDCLRHSGVKGSRE